MKQYIQPQAYSVAFHDEALMQVTSVNGTQVTTYDKAGNTEGLSNEKDLSNGWDDCWNAL